MIELLAALAVAYISIMIVRGRLPFDAMGKIRQIVGITYDDMGMATAKNELAYLMICIYCVSFWVGLAACFLLAFPWWYAFAFAMVASFIEEKI